MSHKKIIKIKINQIKSEYSMDQIILDEEEKIICIRFVVDDIYLISVLKKLSYCNSKLTQCICIYSINTQIIDGYNQMYQLFGTPVIIFFFKNKRILIDNSSGNNNKMKMKILESNNFLKICEFVLYNTKRGKQALFLF
jgi:hypothetical protein